MRAKNDTTPPACDLLAVRDEADVGPGSVERTRAGRTEVIRVRGFLSASDSFFSFFDADGGNVFSLEHLSAVVDAMDRDPDVDRIVLDLLGNGTTVAKLDETMEVIRRAKTPTAAYVTSAFSGFAFLSQAADVVAGPPSAAMGSVNVLLGFREAADDERVRFVSGSALKKDWAEGVFSAKVQRDMENQVAESVKALRNLVGGARGLEEAQLDKIFSGQTFVGQQAVQVGLLDGIHPTMGAFLASLETEATMPQDNTAAPAPGAADQDTATTASAPRAAADEEGLFQRILARLSGTAAAAAPPAVPAAGATPPPVPALVVDPQVAAMAAKMEKMEADLDAMKAKATADAEAALRAEVTASGIPADLVETEVATLDGLRAAGQEELVENRLAALKKHQPLALSPAAFGELGAPATGGFALGGLEPIPAGHTVDVAEASAVAALESEHAGDPEALERALLAMEGGS
jgi:ClpP class serine protease